MDEQITSIAISTELRDRLRIAAAITGRTMRDIAEEALEKHLATLPGQDYLIVREREATP